MIINDIRELFDTDNIIDFIYKYNDFYCLYSSYSLFNGVLMKDCYYCNHQSCYKTDNKFCRNFIYYPLSYLRYQSGWSYYETKFTNPYEFSYIIKVGIKI